MAVRRLADRLRLASLAGTLAAALAAGSASLLGAAPFLVAASALTAGLGATFLAARSALRRVETQLAALLDGVRGLSENDLGLRLAVTSDDEVGALIGYYNRIGEVLRDRRRALVERELLLDTILRGAPMAILLADGRDRVVYANPAARRLAGGPGQVSGRPVPEFLAGAPPALRDALLGGTDGLVTWEEKEHDETWRVGVSVFALHDVRHRLLVAERLTAELTRQEVAVWKKAIRVMSHELNNSLAPISSLVHSARLVLDRPESAARVPEILGTVEERVRHVAAFLEGYARFARLPMPRREPVVWKPFLESVGRLFAFRLEGSVDGREGFFDPGQIQQVLVNLLKNAEEAGSPREEIVLRYARQEDGADVVSILDRGSGMDDAALRQALIPFHSSKRSGTGLGLALSVEIVEAHGGRLEIARRPGGGVAVGFRLPPSPAP